MPDHDPSPHDSSHGNNRNNDNSAYSIPASEASPLLTSFTTFLTLAVHSLLFHRNLYSRNTFLTARAYNLPVQQSRHPGVCAWVNDAVAAVSRQLQLATLHRVVFAIHAPQSKSFRVLERWVFDVDRLPEWGGLTSASANGNSNGAGGGGHGRSEMVLENESAAVDEADEDQQLHDQQQVNWTDVNESLRGALRRLAYAAEKMPDLPAGCTFTLAVELREEAPAPIGVRPSQTLSPFVLSKSTVIVKADRSCPLPHSIRKTGYPRSPISNLGTMPRESKRLLLQPRGPSPRQSGLYKPVQCSSSAGSSSPRRRKLSRSRRIARILQVHRRNSVIFIKDEHPSSYASSCPFSSQIYVDPVLPPFICHAPMLSSNSIHKLPVQEKSQSPSSTCQGAC